MYEIEGGLPFDCWVRDFRIPTRELVLSLYMFTVHCVGGSLSDGLITRLEESYRLCVSNPHKEEAYDRVGLWHQRQTKIFYLLTYTELQT